jgi:3-deoxy-D-manno-octulosonic-acid transferase
MGKIIYRLGIFLLQSFLKLHALFNEKSKLAVEGRKNLFPALKSTFKDIKRPVVWFHCASLGEFEQGRPLMETFKQQFPDYFILLTFFSPSGYEVKKDYEYADYVTYMPFDTLSNAKQFVQISRPIIAFFIKYEFWYFHLKALSVADCFIYSTSAIFRSEQIFFKAYGRFYRNLLKEIDYFFVQNKYSKALLKGININNASVTGDTRFDRVNAIVSSIRVKEPFLSFSQNHLVLVGGSTWEPDIKTIAPFLQQNKEWKAIIAPHNINEQSIKLHEEYLRIPSIRYSQISSKIPDEIRVVIMDNMGMLSQLYQYGKLAFIGGAFGTGLHNTLEAACFGLPIFFGNKNYQKFQEAMQLLEIGAARLVNSPEDFKDQLNSILKNDELAGMSEKADKFVKSNLGATQKIMGFITPIVHQIGKK